MAANQVTSSFVEHVQKSGLFQSPSKTEKTAIAQRITFSDFFLQKLVEKLTGKPIRISGSSNYSNLVISVIVLID